ncbi:MAG: hypothetical protein LBL06_03045 [Treponema sp.]|jgi:hypothetical protein|nr:hypothetical protein [Treponema sp.]
MTRIVVAKDSHNFVSATHNFAGDSHNFASHSHNFARHSEERGNRPKERAAMTGREGGVGFPQGMAPLYLRAVGDGFE